MYGGYYGWGMGFGWIFMVLFCLTIALVIGYGFRVAAGGMHNGGARALDILKRRYARGEITKENYERLKNDLR
jgi:putative membrane protein